MNESKTNSYITLTITRDGAYDYKENLKCKARNFLLKEAAIIDDFFTRPL